VPAYGHIVGIYAHDAICAGYCSWGMDGLSKRATLAITSSGVIFAVCAAHFIFLIHKENLSSTFKTADAATFVIITIAAIIGIIIFNDLLT